MFVKIKDNNNHIYYVVIESQAGSKVRLLQRKHPNLTFSFGA